VQIVSPGSTAVGLRSKLATPFLIRSATSDATELDGLVSTITSLGWRRVAIVGSESFHSSIEYFKAAAQAAGVDVLVTVRIQDTTAVNFEPWRLGLLLNSVRQSGARIIVSITRTVDATTLHYAARVVGLHDPRRFTWLGTFATYTTAMLAPQSFGNTSMAGYVFVRATALSANASAAYRSAFRAAATRYDAAVHGTFDPISHAPFYDAAHEQTIFDTGHALTGDGEPDPWGKCALHPRALPPPLPSTAALHRCPLHDSP
jgi:ABC-type branched-subunit amino acid transport system substrate-binding protein